MDAYAEGEEEAFAVVYDELAPRLHAYLRRLCGSHTTSQDILQQVFLNIHQARSTFARGAAVEPWAYAIARRRAIDWARRTRREPWSEMVERALQSPEETPEQAAVGRQLAEHAQQELARVPELLREAFLLTRLEGLSTAEAADVLGTTRTNVKVRAHRASLLLRERLSRLRFGKESG